MSIEQAIQQLTRSDVIRTIDANGQRIPPGERFSCLYQGRRFDPKQLVAESLAQTKQHKVDPEALEQALYEPFVEALKEREFSVVSNPRQIGDTGLTVMVYEVKKPPLVQENFKRLFSANQNRFYWNRDKFSRLRQGAPVFVVNNSAARVLFGYVQDTLIRAEFDEESHVSRFTHQGETFEVSGEYPEFVCIEVRSLQHPPSGWQWKTFGSGEHSYIAGPEVNAKAVPNNLERVNLLLEVFAREEEIVLQLQTCYQALLSHLVDYDEPEQQHEPRVWYVMQGKSFTSEMGLSYLLSKLEGKGGRSLNHWLAVGDVRPGDIIVHHSAGEVRAISQADSMPYVTSQPDDLHDVRSGDGQRVDLRVLVHLKHPVTLDDIRKKKGRLQKALADVRGPYNRDGTGKQGYLFEFTWEALAILLDGRSLALPEELQRWLPSLDELADDAEETPDEELLSEEAQERRLPVEITQTSAREWLPRVQAYMASQGFHYSLAEVANFYLCMRTKPLAMLAGISGTGKTQLVRQFAKAIGYGDSDHCVLIAVRPDWADSSDLIGYANIQGKFETKPLLDVMARAIEHPDELYFVILDEMNLARVEHYFSEFLSFIETRERDNDDVIVTEALISRADVNGGRPVYLPQNLMVVGTVNMDETTHAFSRKVLDRANAIEMNDIDLAWVSPERDVAAVSGIYADALRAPFLNSNDLSDTHKRNLAAPMAMLMEVNRILEPAGLHFGYRVRDEVAFYLTLHGEEALESLDGFGVDAAIDFQLMQKVLPRIQGSSLSVLKVLIRLLELLAEKPLDDEAEYHSIEKEVDPHATRYPRSVKKLLFMLQRFHDDGFTSYWL
ncbi:McrB family protein [Halomonas beimenensis]|uniref:5-methylcytosine-specific restriction related enzyme n=1 Tax=Halomonas beimenensis TaxID=475662 RepID=A0A291P956_9GAMM|nr:AAA family ATPase [Halomonas beimenensis]ATJ83382.1 5-methylcytosine-specific restriction related enzyme [Halomonas beimenensis]